MPEIIEVKPADLLADSNNPRVPEEGLGQREVLLAIATAADDEIAVLAADIVQYQGVDPSSLPIVVTSKQPNRYVVLEGNRRLTAIRALENPSMFEGAFSASVLAEIRKMSAVYQGKPIEKIACCLMSNPEAAAHWIDLRHTGKNSGAGVVPWGPHEKERFLRRTGKKHETHTRLLDFLEDAGHLTKAERQQVPVTAFARLARTRSIREKLGFSTDRDGALKFRNKDVAIAGLLQITSDLASKKVKTGQIYDLEQRNEYAAKLPTTLISHKGSSKALTLPAAMPPASGAKALARMKRERDRLIPTNWKSSITDYRNRQIAKELRSLSLSEFPNATAVLFRVFVELSADYYLVNTMNKGKDEIRVPGYNLTKKLTEIVEHLLAKGIFKRQDAAPIRAACQSNSFLASSVVSMNEYVHNFLMNPTQQNLITAWEAFDDFLAVIWK